MVQKYDHPIKQIKNEPNRQGPLNGRMINLTSWGYLNLVLILMFTLLVANVCVLVTIICQDSLHVEHQRVIETFEREIQLLKLGIDRSYENHLVRSVDQCGEIKRENSLDIKELATKIESWIRESRNDFQKVQAHVEELSMAMTDAWIVDHKGPKRPTFGRNN